MQTKTSNMQRSLSAFWKPIFLMSFISLSSLIYSQTATNIIVLIGSSTAAGIGASPDSSWANRYSKYLQEQNPPWELINLAVPGFTTYRLMSTHFKSPPNRQHPDSNHNISKAISLKPKAIILALASNDVVSGVPLSVQQANYDSIVSLAHAEQIPVWVTTPVPRTKLDSAHREILKLLTTWVTEHYKEKSIDCWTTLAQADGKIAPTYSFGDGVHENNQGHTVIFERMVEKNILDKISGTKVIPTRIDLVNAMEKIHEDSTLIQAVQKR